MKKILILIILIGLVTQANAGQGQLITYQIAGNDYEGYYISPSKSSPLVILIHDWDGMTAYEIKRADMLADLGYSVFALDLFGKGIRPVEIADKKKLTGELYKDRPKMRMLMDGALEHARTLGADTTRAVVAGYCFGGAASLEWARSGADFKGFAIFHGGLTTPEGQDYSKTQGEILVLHGSVDKVAPMETFAQLAVELETAGVSHEMVAYSNAPHAFTVFGSKRYRETADKKSWNHFVSFLSQTLKTQ